MTDRDEIAQVKARVHLEDVCKSRGMDLRSCNGERLEGCCPFHEDHSPSFSVYVQTQRYYCFGCGAQGDVIDFVRTFDGCSLKEALDRLSPGQRNAPVSEKRQYPQRSKVQVSSSTIDEELPVDHSALLTHALLTYHKTILRMTPVQEYLASRGISLATIRRCVLGYADGITLRLSLRGNEPLWLQARRAGLLTRNGKEWLAGRLIIPDLRGDTCVWMIGRVPPTSLHPVCKTNEKYLGLAIPKTLLGYYAALAELQHPSGRPLQGILVVEGAIDYVLALEWQLPFLCVALLGTHASRRQLQALLHLHEISGLPFIDWHDADERGRLASLHLSKQLQGRHVRPFPEIAMVKDLADLGTQRDGYARLTQAWHALGDGGEL